jgi:hypothetical protein
MSETQILQLIATIAGAALLGIIIAIIISCKNAKICPGEFTMSDKSEPLPHRLNEQEVAEYNAAIERLEQARAEIFGLHYKYAVAMKMNPSEIHIETDGRIFRV